MHRLCSGGAYLRVLIWPINTSRKGASSSAVLFMFVRSKKPCMTTPSCVAAWRLRATLHRAIANAGTYILGTKQWLRLLRAWHASPVYASTPHRPVTHEHAAAVCTFDRLVHHVAVHGPEDTGLTQCGILFSRRTGWAHIPVRATAAGRDAPITCLGCFGPFS